MYNKLFTSILDSSIWLEPMPTRIVWITLLAAMDEDGYAHFSAIENLANRARVTIEECNAAVTVLQNTDPNSADPANGGRRLERVPGGFMVLNAAKYRELGSREKSKEMTRLRVKRHRETQISGPDVTVCNASVTPSEAEAYTETETKTEEGEPPNPPQGDFFAIHGAKEFKSRVCKLFRRKETTQWDDSEKKAFKKAVRIEVDEESWQALERLYSSESPFKRRDVGTFLNHLNGEITKAKNPSSWFYPPGRNGNSAKPAPEPIDYSDF